MISNDINMMSGSLEVVTPDFEALEDGKQLLVMGVIVALGIGEGMGVESDGVDVTVRGHGRNNASKGVVRSISFNEHGVVRSPMS